ncbi:hypothetical protein OA107_03015 [Candidatus Pelagibacter sp.]|nr:hypothetical protein [Candidatus Pelagibacter sp.]
MNKNKDFETYLTISSRKIIILVNTNLNEKIYEEELVLKSNSKEIVIHELDKFLNENIFKIEKKIKNFIKSVCLIIDSDEIFSIQISIKKNNYGELLTKNKLTYILNEARDLCFDTLKENKIIHVLVDNYIIDGQNHINLPQRLKCNHISLDISFLCQPIDSTNTFEQILKKYQISIDRVLSLKYLKNYFQNDNIDLNSIISKAHEGFNPNEALLKPKKSKNTAFFERFFHFFS